MTPLIDIIPRVVNEPHFETMTPKEIHRALAEVSISYGDTVLVHSAYSRIGPWAPDARIFLDLLRDQVGPTGTVILPTFNFQFCQTEVFDVVETPSSMGILTEIARTHPDGYRVKHPIYSFVAFGRYAPQLGRMRYRDSFGADSVFAWLRAQLGQVLSIGLTWTEFWTGLHHVESMVGVPYRFHKYFAGKITYGGDALQDEEGVWGFYVRDIEAGVLTRFEPMGARLEAIRGLVRFGWLGAARLRAFEAQWAHEVAERILRTEDPEGITFKRTTPELAAKDIG